jgi:hypothetical protein
MINNKLIKVFDNVGFSFTIENDHFKILSKLKNYNSLNSTHVGFYIPYIARNISYQYFETGVGEIVFDGAGNISVKRNSISSSSNENKSVFFPDSGNEFYVFANQSYFDTLLNNVIILDRSSILDNISAIYLVDTSNGDISLTLPSPSKKDIFLEFKVIQSSNALTIRDYNDRVLTVLVGSNNYIRLVSTGEDWVVLNKISESANIQSLSENDSVSMLSNPVGSNYSLQYKYDDTTFGSSQAYWYSTASGQALLLGADNLNDANSVLATSGTNNFLFNKNNAANDFIVYGSGTDNRNLFFSYDGKLGINMPSGVKPSTLLHIVNNLCQNCQEGIRLENRASTYPTNITLYYKPSTNIPANTIVSRLQLSASNSSGIQTNYGKIEARAVSSSHGSERGAIDLIVVSGSTGVKTLNTSVENTILGYPNTKITINNNGNMILSNGSNQIEVGSSSTTVSSETVTITGISYLNTINSQNITSPNIYVSSLSQSGLLTMSNGKIANSQITINSNGSLNLPIPSNRILSTTSNGLVTGIYNTDDYFLTQKDITWNKYSPKSATVCLRQVILVNPISSNEFSVDDQILISLSGTNYYRNIDTITLNGGNQITEMLLDTAVPFGDTNDITIQSITKGGYLSLFRYADNETSDSTSHILSIRPNFSTVFNTSKKDTNFEIYGLNNSPALFVQASGSSVGINTSNLFTIPSGQNVIFQQPSNIPASLTVSGWLYSDNIMVGSASSDVPALVSPGIIESSGIRAKKVQYISLEQIDISGNVISSSTSSIINNKVVTTFDQGIRAYANTGDPGLYLYPKINNALSGNAYGGVSFTTFLDRAKSTASGWSYDRKSKTTINTDTPYILGSLATGTYEANGITVTGYGYLYSDLTVNGIAYASEIVSEDIYLRPAPSTNNTGKYIANAFLTLDRNGKIVSQIPTANYTTPTAPQNLSATQGNGIGNGEVSLSWTAPQSNGGTSILAYILEFSLDSGSTWTRLPVGNYTLNRALSNSTHCSILGLSSLNTYRFRVAAQNNVGIGSFSQNSSAITPASSAPKAVNNITYTRTFNDNNTSSIALSWSASDAGGSAIIGYTIQESTDKGLTWQDYNNTSNLIDDTSETIYGTSSSLDYYYRVSAWNNYNSLNNQSAFAYSYVSGTNPGAPFDTIDSSFSNWDFGMVLFTGVC